MGLQLWNQNKFDESKTEYSKALALNARLDVSCYSRGLCEGRLNNLDNAISDFNEAIKINGKDGDYYEQRAKIFQRKQEWDKAIGDYALAVTHHTEPTKKTECTVSLIV